MSLTLKWIDVDETILCWHFVSTWSWDEYYRVLDQSNTLIESKPYPVSVVVDMQDIVRFPHGILTHASNGLATRRQNNFQTVIILNHSTLLALYNTFIRFHSRLYPQHVNHLHLVASWGGALELLPDHHSLNHNPELSRP